MVISNDRRSAISISINPDKGAGADFQCAMREVGLDSIGIDTHISPRLDGGQFSQKTNQIVADLVRAILRAMRIAQHSATFFLTISCNTVSLPVFVDPALLIVRGNIPEFDQRAKIILTTDVIANFCKKNSEKQQKTLVLGTHPFQTVMAEIYGSDVTTFANYSQADHRDSILVQEIIWRVKAAQNSDISTAPHYANIHSKQVLVKRVAQLEKRLNELDFSTVVMGCTELPTAFLLFGSDKRRSFILKDPAHLVARKILTLKNDLYVD